MSKSNILTGFVVALCLLFVFLEFNQYYWWSLIVKSFIVPIITVLYFLNVKERSIFISLFFIVFSISELLILINFNSEFDFQYFIGNTLYIIAYSSLIYEIVMSINLRRIFKEYLMHIVVLSFLNIYIIYVLLQIVNPHLEGYWFFIEFVYNIVMLILLSLSFLNFLYQDSKKTLLLLFGSLSIVFF